ncbi:BolA family transcriptional regulator [Hahella sp. CCB-MM4]|uniref:BolA family protein n=1 Tax=Hahella sp. (strain CCB-MM4) TaxID=1926491 RepID=UPI000B9B840F|nr:BolA/IbaG family iron-sulfur metabolism protein [Hahella sp. CCB-MM4]OZG72611.1 BolA family transcriptional regulator [Hahella sp. CCB-MM4]
MTIQQSIENTLNDDFQPSHLEVVNESHMHSVPPNSETHFKVVLVSDQFEGLRSVQRHQKVYGALGEFMRNGVHALALHTYTPDEWVETGNAPASPNCMGGSKHDKRA